MKKAIILGSGIGGLVTGAVLSKYFDEVLILEKDVPGEGPQTRIGVPQGEHVHILLKRAQLELEKLFPGFEKEVESHSVPQVNWSSDTFWINRSGKAPIYPSSITAFSCSRGLLEFILRNRVSKIKNVHIQINTEVVGLFVKSDAKTVRGVHTKNNQSGEACTIEADLVVDASGRNSRLPLYLKEMGLPTVSLKTVESKLGYAGRLVRRPQEWLYQWTQAYVQLAPPEHQRGGILCPIENGLWQVNLIGVGKDSPPVDEEGYRAFAKSLRSKEIEQALTHGIPAGPIRVFRRTANVLREYHRLQSWPRGVVALGDSVCSFNPVYGQGMTVAILGGLLLEKFLQKKKKNWEIKFQKKLAALIAAPWMLATSEDFRITSVLCEGVKKTWITRFMHRYLDYVVQRGNSDITINETFLEVLHMLKPPTALFKPKPLGGYFLRL